MFKIQNIFYLLVTMTIFSCANVPQIDRGRISSRIMQIDPHPEESYFLEEVNAYREASVGGAQAAGGGCGCN